MARQVSVRRLLLPLVLLTAPLGSGDPCLVSLQRKLIRTPSKSGCETEAVSKRASSKASFFTALSAIHDRRDVSAWKALRLGSEPARSYFFPDRLRQRRFGTTSPTINSAAAPASVVPPPKSFKPTSARWVRGIAELGCTSSPRRASKSSPFGTLGQGAGTVAPA